MANVLEVPMLAEVDLDLTGSPQSNVWITYDIAFSANYLTYLASSGAEMMEIWEAAFFNEGEFSGTVASSGVKWYSSDNNTTTTASFGPTTAMQFYRFEEHITAATPRTRAVYIDGVSIGTLTSSEPLADISWVYLKPGGVPGTGRIAYYDNFKVGTTRGGSEVTSDNFEGTLNPLFQNFGASIIANPGIAPAATPAAPALSDAQRVGIAFDDGPLVADPTFTFIDGTDNLVAGYDIQTGKQTELDRTDTGTGTVYLHDTTGDFDPMNTGGAYFGKLVGKQILFQLFNPVTETWEKQWRGKIRDYNYDIVGVLGADGKPIVANIQIDCVDVFDYLGGYGVQPGVDGDTPPAGSEGIVFYEDTAGTVNDRTVQALTDAGVDSTRYVVFSGNVKVQETRYDPGDAILTVLRDAADAEFPGLANIYVDRFGRFVFHGRRARFDPDGVIADGPVSSDTWDFHRWKVGDGTAITGDSAYAQIRVLGYTHGESDIVNSAISWPAGMADTDMPGQVFQDATSITAHGKHSLPPMSDMIISACPTTGNTPKQECAKFAEFFVHYLKNPQTRVTDCMVKAISPADPRATSTWDVLCRADISDIMRTTVGYPNATGIDMDNYVEGYTKRVRPLNPTHDYVEVEFNLTPTAWSMDPDMILAV